MLGLRHASRLLVPWWPRARSIRGRILRILVLSLAMVLALLGSAMASEINAYQAAVTTKSTVQLALAVQGLIHQVQRERGLTVGLLGGSTSFRPRLDAERKLEDAAQAKLNRLLATQPPDAALVQAAEAKLSSLPTVRAEVDAHAADRAVTLQYFTDAIAPLNNLGLGINSTSDNTLRIGLQALQSLGELKEDTGQERALMSGVFSAGHFRAGEFLQFEQMKAAQQAARALFDRAAAPDQEAALTADTRTAVADQIAQYEAIAVAAGSSRSGRITQHVVPIDWFNTMTAYIDLLRGTQNVVGTDITARAQSLEDSALQRLIIFAVFALVAAVFELLLSIGALRSIIRPLATLAAEADDVATRRLPKAVEQIQEGEKGAITPEPVRVPARSGSEIASVAAAIDRVHGSAMSLASEQAVLRRNTSDSMVNLARRNQNLVRRQLGFISKLELDEQDPKVLGDLFELDHLATRMRRNAESLLVLVGEETPRLWAKPVPVSDVIRAALSEVEEYRRVTLRRLDDAKINGGAVAELAHLLAELLENALSFSPPDAEVEILGRSSGKGYLIAVIDYGVGMPPEQLAQSNRRLRGEERFDVAPTRFLGHYVVGRLAQRLGVEVCVTESPTSGVTARVLIPGELASEQVKPGPAPRAHTTTHLSQTPPVAGLPELTARQMPQHPATRSAVASQVAVPSSTEPATIAAADLSGGRQSDHTRNGLRKRSVRQPGTTRPVPGPRVEEEFGLSAPDDVRSLLTAFSSGYQRGQSRSTVSPEDNS
jgi:signal transduction histidine kinase